jgi:hypothetical protein
MKVNYPQTILKKLQGFTPAEEYLHRLCNDTFLSFWSYPNVFRDQGRTNSKRNISKGDGKEVCDLLVIFENHVFIFSDKNCAFQQDIDIELSWSRWYRNTVKEAARQLWGAERWIFEHPRNLFIDKKCTQPFPFDIPSRDKAIVHRIVVAHGASRECIRQLGGSGTLMINPSIIGDMHIRTSNSRCLPFTIGQVDSARGYVHVFDDVSLEIVMQTLDTISDFSTYLTKKAKFITSKKLMMASGEDDLLAYYLHDVGPDGQHDFVLEDNIQILSITEGLWKSFSVSPQRMRQIEANKISYAWDRLIETFIGHVVHGTSYYMSDADVKSQDILFRILAKENRTRRRLLATSLISALADTPKQSKLTRTIAPSSPGDPYYVFLILPRPSNGDISQYRDFRVRLLQQYCQITRLRFPDAKDIIGIATETGLDRELKSQDCVYYDGSKWDDSTRKEAEDFQNQLQDAGLLDKRTMFKDNIKEYPDSTNEKHVPTKMKSKDRNKPCRCGSGIKFKKCCGKATVTLERVPNKKDETRLIGQES